MKIRLLLISAITLSGISLQASDNGQQPVPQQVEKKEGVSMGKIALGAALGIVEGFWEGLFDRGVMAVGYPLPVGGAFKALIALGIGSYAGKEAGIANGVAGAITYLAIQMAWRSTSNNSYNKYY